MSIEVIHHPDVNRYLILEDGVQVGLAAYRRTEDAIDIVHTEIDPAHGGKGLGGKLVQGMLDQIRAEAGTIIPSCPFVASWVDKHPDYEDLLH